MWQVFPASRQLGLWAEPQVPPALPLALGLGSAVMFGAFASSIRGASSIGAAVTVSQGGCED